MKSHTAWLASYPKSGNTWVRAWLNALQLGEAPNLNQLSGMQLHNSMDAGLGLSLGDLSPAQIGPMMRLSWATSRTLDGSFITRKTHHAWVDGPDGFPISWQPDGARAVYLIRDPRAVAVSWAHHAGISLAESVSCLATDIRSDIWASVRTGDVLSTWSNHVRSWTSQRDIPLIVVTYESMVHEPAVQLARIANFLDIRCTPAQIDAAVEACAFTTLATREIFEGFVEAIGDRAFFRRGETDSWRQELPPELAEQIVKDQGDVMAEFGYAP